MAFVGYQEDAGENGVLVDASVRSSQATAPGFVQGLTFQQVVNGTNKSVFDRLTDPKNMGSFNAAVQDQGFIQLGISKRSSINQLKAFTGVSIEKDAGWNPIESIKGLGPSFEGNYEQLMNTQNEEDFKLLVEDIQNAKNRNKVFDSAGYDGTATVAAMLTDPTNYIPIAPGASMINKALRATALRGVKGRIALPAHAVSPFDRDIAIRTIWGEARNQGDNGMAAVAHVMINRLASGNYGKSLSEIALAKNQFEPWGNATTKKAMEKLSPSSPEYKRIGSILDQVMTGHLPDITNGADMFYAPKAQTAMGRKPPSWAKGTPMARVGDHDFFHSGGNPVDQARKQSIQAANATFWTTEASAGLEVFGQLMANPDYSASDAIGVMGSATMLGLGGGAIIRTMGDLRANKMALDQNSYNNLLRKKLDSLNGYGDAPETFSIKNITKAMKEYDGPFYESAAKGLNLEGPNYHVPDGEYDVVMNDGKWKGTSRKIQIKTMKTQDDFNEARRLLVNGYKKMDKESFPHLANLISMYGEDQVAGATLMKMHISSPAAFFDGADVVIINDPIFQTAFKDFTNRFKSNFKKLDEEIMKNAKDLSKGGPNQDLYGVKDIKNFDEFKFLAVHHELTHAKNQAADAVDDYIVRERRANQGALDALMNERKNIAVRDWMENRDVIFKNLNDSIGRDAKSIGAMAMTSTDPVEVYKVSGVARFLRYTNPILDTVVGHSNSAKRIMGGLFENNLLTNENMEGISTNTGGAVSTRVRVQMGRLATFQDDLGKQFKAFQKEMMNQNKTPMGRAQFEREVWLHTFGSSSMADNPFIQRAADRFKKDITHPTLKNAQEVGLIKKGAGENYSPVIFNRQAIRADRSNFSEAVRRAVLKGYDEYQVNPKGKKQPSFDPYTETSKFDKFVDEYTEFWAAQTDTAVVGMETKSGRTKMRVDFPMAYTEMQDYMENTIGEVASRYMRSMTPDIEMLRTYKSLDLKNEINVVTKEYDDLIAAASNDVARKSLEKEKARVLDNINWAVKNIRNRDDYSMMTSEGMRTAIKALNLWTFTKGMGMFPINAMAESSIPVLIHGYANTYGQIMKDYSNDFKGMKMAKELAMSSGIATDKALGDRMTAIMDGTNGAIDQNTLERRIDRFMGGAAKLFGMPYINDTFRTMSTMWNNNMFGKDIATIASGRGKMDDMTRARYANLGIDQEVAVRLMDQMEKHGEWIEGNFVPNLENWNAKDALAYRAALLKAVDNEFLIPQAADMPKFAQTPVGKPLFFLRSYTFTATNRLALAGMQRGLSPDMAKGMAGVLAMGMLSNALYQAANGRDQPEGVEMIYGAMDRAGIFGLFWEANNLMDRTVGIGLGDGERAMEYSNPIEQIGGPNAYTIGDAVDFIGQPSMGSAGDLMPLGNWLPLEAAKRVLIQ